MRRVKVRTEQSAFFGGEDDKQQRTFRFGGIRGKSPRQLNYSDRARTIVVRAVEYLAIAHAVVIVVPTENDRLVFKLGIVAFNHADYVVSGGAAMFTVYDVNFDSGVGQRLRVALQRCVNRGLQFTGFL